MPWKRSDKKEKKQQKGKEATKRKRSNKKEKRQQKRKEATKKKRSNKKEKKQQKRKEATKKKRNNKKEKKQPKRKEATKKKSYVNDCTEVHRWQMQVVTSNNAQIHTIAHTHIHVSIRI